MLLGGLALAIIMGLLVVAVFLKEDRTGEDIFAGIMSACICVIGITMVVVSVVSKIQSQIADQTVLKDGRYYNVLSVTKDVDNTNTQYVIYYQTRGEIRDVELTSTNSVPTGMVRWDKKTQIFVSMAAEPAK